MKKHLLPLLLLCFVLLPIRLSSQNRSAIIKYQGVINEKYVDSFVKALEADKDVSMHLKQEIAKYYQSAQPEIFYLHIQGLESYYYTDFSLKVEGEDNAGSLASNDDYYTNSKTGAIIKLNETIGNVLHTSEKYWEITDEVKMIGDYRCIQAIPVYKRYNEKTDTYYYKKRTKVWFTPDIPLSFGPAQYKGLPGLILQIEHRRYTLTAIHIDLNPDEADLKINRVDENERIISFQELIRRQKEMRKNRY
ncbi:GLPGLI family protein [Joostella sp. CR20]|uniref:GLPGLI family protein n=1 Tax=Joostella sp. CR20 TaxID=2804312 RepID=UPI00313C201C